MQALRKFERPWLSIVMAILIPLALIGWAIDASWVHVNIQSETIKAVVIAVACGCEVYLLTRGVWPAEIVVDKPNGKITLKAGCPLIFKPKVFETADIQKILVVDLKGRVGNPKVYALEFIKNDGERIMYGDNWTPDREKLEKWRDEIANFAGIDNITRLSN